MPHQQFQSCIEACIAINALKPAACARRNAAAWPPHSPAARALARARVLRLISTHSAFSALRAE